VPSLCDNLKPAELYAAQVEPAQMVLGMALIVASQATQSAQCVAEVGCAQGLGHVALPTSCRTHIYIRTQLGACSLTRCWKCQVPGAAEAPHNVWRWSS
jgi:hypothetical protein